HEVFHEIQTAIRPLMTHVQTREQVDDLLQSLGRIRYDRSSRETIHDPPVVWHKGRPRTQRLTGATESRLAGGGGQASKRRREDQHDKENVNGEPQRKKAKLRCALCHQEGHNRATCSLGRT
ncbi:hypothetical protein B0H13DRAFT_1589675, partial [Mycena leptocephala]